MHETRSPLPLTGLNRPSKNEGRLLIRISVVVEWLPRILYNRLDFCAFRLNRSPEKHCISTTILRQFLVYNNLYLFTSLQCKLRDKTLIKALRLERVTL